jgi:hypothetical protein
MATSFTAPHAEALIFVNSTTCGARRVKSYGMFYDLLAQRVPDRSALIKTNEEGYAIILDDPPAVGDGLPSGGQCKRNRSRVRLRR